MRNIWLGLVLVVRVFFSCGPGSLFLIFVLVAQVWGDDVLNALRDVYCSRFTC